MPLDRRHTQFCAEYCISTSAADAVTKYASAGVVATILSTDFITSVSADAVLVKTTVLVNTASAEKVSDAVFSHTVCARYKCLTLHYQRQILQHGKITQPSHVIRLTEMHESQKFTKFNTLENI